MSDPVLLTEKKTYLTFVVEGFEEYNKETNTYKNVTRFELIARTAKEALHKAKQTIKCNDYKVWAVTERYVDTK